MLESISDLVWGNYRPWSLGRDELDMVHDISVNQLDMVKILQADGMTNNQIAHEMNYRGYINPNTGKRWTAMGIKAFSRKQADTL